MRKYPVLDSIKPVDYKIINNIPIATKDEMSTEDTEGNKVRETLVDSNFPTYNFVTWLNQEFVALEN